jgi:hypothetical protein
MKKKGDAKKGSLEECYQRLYQAQSSGDRVRIKIWQDIIKKLESKDANNKN